MKILSLGQKLRRLRKEKGLTLEVLGGDHVSKAHLSIIENGKASPSIDLLKYLSEKLEVELEYLLETEKEQAIKFCNLWLKEMGLKTKLQKTEDAKEIYEEIREVATDYKLLDILGKSSLLMAQTYININDYDNGLLYIQKSIYYSTKSENILRIIKSYIKEGEIYEVTGMYENAIQKYKQSLDFFKSLKFEDVRLKSQIFHKISKCYYEINDKKMALKFSEKACIMDEKLNRPKGYIEDLINYSRASILNEDYDNALNALLEAENLLVDEEEKYAKAKIENNLGVIYLKNRKFEKAFKHLIASKQLKEEHKMDELPETLFSLYTYYIEKGQIEKAFEQLGYAIKFSEDRNLIEYKIKGINIYISYYLRQRRYDEASDKIIELIDLLNETNGRKEGLIDAYLELGNTYSLMGKNDKAVDYFKKGYSLKSV